MSPLTIVLFTIPLLWTGVYLLQQVRRGTAARKRLGIRERLQNAICASGLNPDFLLAVPPEKIQNYGELYRNQGVFGVREGRITIITFDGNILVGFAVRENIERLARSGFRKTPLTTLFADHRKSLYRRPQIRVGSELIHLYPVWFSLCDTRNSDWQKFADLQRQFRESAENWETVVAEFFGPATVAP